jgi:hypothetical protein
LTAAERDRVHGCYPCGAESLVIEVAIHSESLMGVYQVCEFNPHHPASDDATPAGLGVTLGADTGVPNRFLGRGDGEAMISVCELENLPVLDCRVQIKSLHLGSDLHRKATGIKVRDGSNPSAIC